MFTTIAIVTIFSAIIVFFSDDFMKYIKKLTAKPYVFLAFGVLILSACMDMYPDSILWLVIAWWIGLLYVVHGLSCVLGQFANQLLAKWILILLLSTVPVVIALHLDARKRRYTLYNDNVIKTRGYAIGFVLWITTILFFVLDIPGTNFTG